MLKQRIVTAIALIVPLVAAVIWLSDAGWAALLGIVVLLAAWEWAAIAGTPTPMMRTGYVSLIAGAMVALYCLPDWLGKMLVGLALLGWLVGLLLVIGYERSRSMPRFNAGFMWLIGCLTLLPAWHGLIYLRGNTVAGEYWVLFLFVLIWGADSVAYFAGRRWGQRKLAAAVSPGKTLEGLGGALAAGVFIGSVMITTAPGAVDFALAAGLIGLSLITVLMSVLGDLLESLFKRLAGLKDSGNWLPGHGGVLDRIDSLTAAAPVFLVGLWWLGVTT